jgi:hypothetical protein
MSTKISYCKHFGRSTVAFHVPVHPTIGTGDWSQKFREKRDRERGRRRERERK